MAVMKVGAAGIETISGAMKKLNGNYDASGDLIGE